MAEILSCLFKKVWLKKVQIQPLTNPVVLLGDQAMRKTSLVSVSTSRYSYEIIAL